MELSQTPTSSRLPQYQLQVGALCSNLTVWTHARHRLCWLNISLDAELPMMSASCPGILLHIPRRDPAPLQANVLPALWPECGEVWTILCIYTYSISLVHKPQITFWLAIFQGNYVSIDLWKMSRNVCVGHRCAAHNVWAECSESGRWCGVFVPAQNQEGDST